MLFSLAAFLCQVLNKGNTERKGKLVSYRKPTNKVDGSGYTAP